MQPLGLVFVRLLLRVEDERFQLRRSLQCQYRVIGTRIVPLEAQLDALAVKRGGVSLDLDVLLQQPVNGLLRFMQLNAQRRLFMELELLLYRFRQVPAEEQKGVLAVAFGVQETPGFIGSVIHGASSIQKGKLNGA